MGRTSNIVLGIVLCVSALGLSAYAQGGGMMGSGMMGYDQHQIDHNLVIPQIAVGQEYVTSLILTNLGNSQMMTWVPEQDLGTTGTIYFYNEDGSARFISVNGNAPVSQMTFALGPSTSARYELTADGPTSSGWALVIVDPPSGGADWGMMDGQTMTGGMRLMSSVFYAYHDDSQTFSRVGVTASMYEMGQFFNAMIPAQIQGDMSTAMALVNTGNQTATIQANLMDENGQLFASKQFQLPAGNQMIRFVFQMFDGLPADFQGSWQIQTADEGVVAMGILMGNKIMTSVPMIHYGQVSLTQ